MRKILAIGLLGLLAIGCFAQTIVYNASPTFEWDAVSQYVDLTPFDPADVVEYEVFRADPATHVNQVPQGVTTGLTMPLIVAGGPWAYGVRTILTTDGGATVLYSNIAWSDVEGAPGPFLYKSPQTVIPTAPSGLRTQ